jgi:hypothetical protein
MPVTRWIGSRESAKQKRKALQMLALSGVVRPSHVELRYTIPLFKAGSALHVHPPTCRAAEPQSMKNVPAAQPRLTSTRPLFERIRSIGLPIPPLSRIRELLTA